MLSRQEVKKYVVPVVAIIALAMGVSQIAQRTKHKPIVQPQLETISNSLGIELIQVPGGSFEMGSASANDSDANEAPAHNVTVQPFYLSRHEITQAQWVKVMGKNPSRFQDPRRPVEQVTWQDVQSFIEKLNLLERSTKYRLPSEAEWEYAARAGQKTRYFFADEVNALPQYAWFGQEDNVGTRPVSQRKPNPWGFYDIYGNVWEWVQDCWHDDYRGAPADARVWAGGDCSIRMLRGGGWDSPASYARSAVRGSYAAELNDAANGFRLARSLGT